MDAVRTKLTEIENRYNAISDEMLKEEVYSNPSKLTRLSREQASLKQAVDAWVQLRSLDERIEQADEMLASLPGGRIGVLLAPPQPDGRLIIACLHRLLERETTLSSLTMRTLRAFPKELLCALTLRELL